MSLASIRNAFSTLQVLAPMVVRESSATTIQTPETVSALCADMLDLGVETFRVLLLSVRRKLIAAVNVSVGTTASCLVHPREVFRAAIAGGATAILVVHNHPGGDPSPSAEDIQVTRQLVEAGKILDIQVTDHVIVARRDDPATPNYCSIRASGLVAFG